MSGLGLSAGGVLPERVLEIRSRLGQVGVSRGSANGAFDAVLTSARSGTGGQTAPAATAGTGTAALPSSLATTLGSGVGAGTGVGGVPPAGPVTGGSSPAGQAVIEAAKVHLGVPYLWGGTDPEKGFDCSGLIQAAYRDIGVELPKWSRHQATMGVEVPSIDEALPGDILYFGRPVTHVALYAGDGQMLHAPRRGEVVKIESIDRTITGIRRVVDPATGSPTAATGPAPAPTDFEAGAAERSYQPLFEEAGRRWNVDPALLAAVARAESNFNPTAVSPAGAQGLMQFMPATAAEMGVDPWNPASAIDGAARYLRTSLDAFGDTTLAIASYNAGRGAVTRHGGVPPYRETRDYVEKVLAAWRARS